MKKDMNMVLAEVLGALLAGDMDLVAELDKAAEKEIERQREEIEFARVADPSIDAFLNELTGGEDLEEFVVKMAINGVSEKDFERMLNEAYLTSSQKKEQTASPMEKAKKKAKDKRPEMDLMMVLEQVMMEDMDLEDKIGYLIDKYASLEESMVRDARKNKDEDMINALLGGAAIYSLVVEDLKGLLS